MPIPGTRRRNSLEQIRAALDVRLSSEEIEALKTAFPPGVTAGARYPEKQMKALGIQGKAMLLRDIRLPRRDQR